MRCAADDDSHNAGRGWHHAITEWNKTEMASSSTPSRAAVRREWSKVRGFACVQGAVTLAPRPTVAARRELQRWSKIVRYQQALAKANSAYFVHRRGQPDAPTILMSAGHAVQRCLCFVAVTGCLNRLVISDCSSRASRQAAVGGNPAGPHSRGHCAGSARRLPHGAWRRCARQAAQEAGRDA
jgi:hypothetical protein